MFVAHFKRYRNMIFCSILFFYIGCRITLSLVNVECVDAVSSPVKRSEYDKVEYAVLIMSGADRPEFEGRRNVIRATWMNFAANFIVENGERLHKWNHTWNTKVMRAPHNFIKCFFTIGTEGLEPQKLQQLKTENLRYNDMLLLEDLEDSYKNLAQKVMKSLQWFSKNMKNLKYLIKCDDDSFVRIDLVVKELEAFAPDMSSAESRQYTSIQKPLPSYKGLYWGYFNGKARVYEKGKWQEKEWFLSNNYLPYALGGGYVISRSIVDFIASNTNFLSLYQSEDVSMGVWTAALANVNRVHDIRFDTEWKSRGCSNYMLIRHKQTTSDMYEMYTNLVEYKGLKLCTFETVIRKPYIYNWKTLPNACCEPLKV